MNTANFKKSKLIDASIRVLLAIFLVLTMVPKALSADKAHASVDPNTGLNETSDFGNFVYDANDASKNTMTFSEASILEKVGIKSETSASVQTSAEAEVLALLVNSGYSLQNNKLPAANTGYKATTSKVSSVVSKLNCLAVENVKDTTNWKFTTSDPAEACKNGVVDVNLAFANLKAEYSVTLSSGSANSDVTLNLNSAGATGTVVLSPTTAKDANGGVTYKLSVDVKLKVLKNESVNYSVTVSNSTINNSFFNESDNQVKQTLGESGTYFNNLTVDIASKNLIEKKVEYSATDLFVGGAAPTGKVVKVIDGTAYPAISPVYDDTTPMFTINLNEVSDSTVIAKLGVFETDTSTTPLETFTVNIGKITLIELGDFNIISNLGKSQFDARSSDDQMKYVKSLLNGKEISSVKLYIKDDATLWNPYTLDATTGAKFDVVISDGQYVLKTGEDDVTKYYNIKFVNGNDVKVNAPKTYAEASIKVFDGTGDEALVLESNTWVGTNTSENPVKFECDKCLSSADINGAYTDRSTPFLNTTLKIKQPNTGIIYVKNTSLTSEYDQSIIMTVSKIVYYYPLGPDYVSYKVSDNTTSQTGNWFIDTLNNINYFFSKNNIKVTFKFNSDVTGINEVKVKTDFQEDPMVANKVSEDDDTTWYILLDKTGNENSDFQLDIKSWKITSKNGVKLQEVNDVWNDAMEDQPTDIIGNSPGISNVDVKWYETDFEKTYDNPFDTKNNQNLKISIDDKYFKYSANFFANSGKAYDYDVVTVDSWEYGAKGTKIERETVHYKASDFINSNEMTIHCDGVNDKTVFYSVTKKYVKDGLNRCAPDGKDVSKTWAFCVDNLGPVVTKIEWDVPDKENGHYNQARTASVYLTEYAAKLETQSSVLAGISVKGFLNDDAKFSADSPVWLADYSWKYVIAFGDMASNKAEGNCKLDVSGKDIHKNNLIALEGVALAQSFVQDYTAPVYKCVWDSEPSVQNEHENVKYFKSNRRVMNITVNEEYSWASDSTMSVSINTGYSDSYSYAFASWEGSSPNYSSSVVCSGDNSHFQFSVYGEDLAGNTARLDTLSGATTWDSGKFALDIIDPVLTIQFDKNNPANGHYFNSNRTATITVKERNFYDQFTSPECSLEDSNGNKSSFNIGKDGWANPGDDTYTKSVNFYAEGDYVFSIGVKDLANNSVSNGPHTFTQDWTCPTLNVSWDNNNDVNGKYYTNARTAILAIDEHNFNGGDIHINPVVTPGHDGTTGNFSISGWSDNGNSHVATVSFPSQGTYTMTVDGMDLATNVMTPYAQGEFILDWTKPVIQISGIENRSAYKEAAQPSVTINDCNMSTATTCNVSNLGATPAQPYSAGPSQTDAQYTYSYNDPEKVSENDGVYRIEVNAVDMAGNTDTQSMVWSVNRFGSTYVINSETEEIMNGYVNNNNKKDVKVTEINPSDIDSSTVEMTKKSFTSKLDENKDYTVQSSGGGESWVEREYTISKDYFKDDGNYEFRFTSKDAAGNENDNTGENKNKDRNGQVNVKFTLDNVNPSSMFNNLSDAQYDEVKHDATVVFEDNTKEFTEAKVIVDGEENYISGDDLKNEKYNVGFTLKEADSPHTIEVVSTDKAGNTMDTQSKEVLVSTNPFVRWFYNTPLFVGTLVGAGVVIAGGVGIFLFRKRKIV